MVHDPDYGGTVNAAASRIRTIIPANLVEKFTDASGISQKDFQMCNPARCGEICAIDGSNVILMESGSMALALIRAAQTTFQDMERSRRSLTPMTFALIGPEAENTDFSVLYHDCFGMFPGTPLSNDDRSKAAGILRDTVEYWITEQMATGLAPGALLLRDGPLRVSHASHDPVLARIEQTCRNRNISLAGVSKRTTATWGGGHPLLPSVSGLAEALGVKTPWWIPIDPTILDHTQFPQWQHGQMYIASLHPRARSPLKIELPKNLPTGKVQEIMGRLASCSGDGRIPGYPYPLFDAHRTVALTEEVVDQVHHDLMGSIVASGIDRQTFEILFGDYHDEFARY